MVFPQNAHIGYIHDAKHYILISSKTLRWINFPGTLLRIDKVVKKTGKWEKKQMSGGVRNKKIAITKIYYSIANVMKDGAYYSNFCLIKGIKI